MKAERKQARIKKLYNRTIVRPLENEYKTKASYRAALKKYTAPKTNRFKNVGQFYALESDVKYLQNLAKKYNKQRKEFFSRIKNKPIISGGKEREQTVEEYAKMLANGPGTKFYQFMNPQNINLETYENEEQLQRKIERLEKQTSEEYWEYRNEIFKQNFIESLTVVSDTTKTDISDIIQAVKDMSGAEFLEQYYRNDDFSMVFAWSNPEALILESEKKFASLRSAFGINGGD